MKHFDIIAAVLVVVGALNWGLIAIARFDLVAGLFGMQFGEVSAASALVYGLVGLAGLYQAGRGRACRTAGRIPRRSRVVRPCNPQLYTEQRQMKKMMVGLVATMTITGAAAKMAAATTDKDIVDTAVAAGFFEDAGEGTQGGRPRPETAGAGPFMVFAPTDEAFAKLPAGTLEALLKPENSEAAAHPYISCRRRENHGGRGAQNQLGEGSQRGNADDCIPRWRRDR